MRLLPPPRADLALGYRSWAEYAEAELKPTEGLAAEVRRQLVGMLSQAGMSTRAIAPTVGVTQKTIVKDRQVIPQVSPERIDPHTGEIVPGPTFKPTEVTDWDQDDIDLMDQLDQEAVDAWEDRTVPRVTGLDGKTYRRPGPEPKPKASRTPITDSFFAPSRGSGVTGSRVCHGPRLLTFNVR